MKSVAVCWTAFVVTVGSFGQIAAQDAAIADRDSTHPGLAVLTRLDRNRDGILDSTEIPEQVKPFAKATVKRFESKRPTSDSRVCISSTDAGRFQIDLVALDQLVCQTDLEQVRATQKIVTVTPKAGSLANFAAVLVGAHDENRDGHLSGDECTALGNGRHKMDINRDGKITVAEITVRMRTLNQQSQQSLATVAISDTELSPDFAQLDRNRDGQIQMSEFSTRWTSQKTTDFYQKDRNRDAIITHREWLQHQVEQEAISKHD